MRDLNHRSRLSAVGTRMVGQESHALLRGGQPHSADDLASRFLEMDGAAIPSEVTGKSLLPVLEDDTPIRDSTILGMFTGPICAMGGDYAYFRYPEDTSCEGLGLYTLCPQHLAKQFDVEELRTAELHPPFDFTKEAPVLRFEMLPRNGQVGSDHKTLGDTETALYCLRDDPRQTTPLNDPVAEARMIAIIERHLRVHDAPEETFDHFGLAAKFAASPAADTGVSERHVHSAE